MISLEKTDENRLTDGEKQMKEYVIEYKQGELQWQSVPYLYVDEYLWGSPESIAMKAQICYDERALYIHMEAKEEQIRAEHTGPLSMVCEDSCMEIFFCPEEQDDRYLNFEINPNGCTFIGISHCRADNVRLCPPNEEELFHKQVYRTADGWEVFYQIPVSFLRVFFPGYRLASGKKISANCYKCGDLTAQPHYLSWNPVRHPTPDFHRSCDFGRMILR